MTGQSEFDYERLVARARELAYVLAGRHITVRDLRVTSHRESTFFFPDGLRALVSHIDPSAEPLQPPLYGERTVVLTDRRRKFSLRIAIAIQFSASRSSHVLSYLGADELRDGTHVAAMKATLVKLFNRFRASKSGDARPSLRWKDIAPGITAAILIRHPYPHLAGSFGDAALVNPEVRAPIRRLVMDIVSDQLQEETMLRYLAFCLSEKPARARRHSAERRDV